MCFFISIIVRGGEAEAIDAALRRHGRRAKPFDNASVRNALHPDENHFLTTVGHCDCGTVLSPTEHTSGRLNGRKLKDVAKLKKKGWSATKIERWVADRTKADERAEEYNQINAPDSIDLWIQAIDDVMSVAGVDQAGILLHFYSGTLEDEVIQLTRKRVSVRDFAIGLREIKEDQLLIATSASA